MNKEAAEIMFQAFFDELGQIEKLAMEQEVMDKEAFLGGAIRAGKAAIGGLKGAVKSVPTGVAQIGQMGAKGTGQYLKGAWQAGKKVYGKPGAGRIGSAIAGLKGVAATPVGSTLALGGAALGTAGVAGAGLGRATAPRRR